MSSLIYLIATGFYIFGFAAMFRYSLRRDVECDLEQNKSEAFLFAFLWPVFVAFMVAIILIEELIFLVCAVYRSFHSKWRGKKC